MKYLIHALTLSLLVAFVVYTAPKIPESYKGIYFLSCVLLGFIGNIIARLIGERFE